MRQIRWLPNADDDRFVLLTADRLRLYRAGTGNHHQPTLISEHDIVNSNTDVDRLRCFDVNPQLHALVACGYNNGRVALIWPDGAAIDTNKLSGREFNRSHPRSCSSLAWNPSQQYWLAATYEKPRSADYYGLILYDVCARPTSALSTEKMTNAQQQPKVLVESTRALNELLPNESAHSIAWFRESARGHVLAVSSSSRTIRIYDLRDTSRAQQQTQTRCVQGLCVDPSNDWRLAAYADTSLVVYDRRNMTAKPVFSVVNLSEPIVRIQWDPVRANILTCATRNSAVIRNYHLMQTPSTPAADDGEYHHLDTHITVSNCGFISDYDWHPTEQNRLLAVSLADSPEFIVDTTVCEHVSLSWSPNGDLAVSLGASMSTFGQLNCATSDDGGVDIGEVMRRRADVNYGTSTIRACIELMDADANAGDDLRWLWKWMERLTTALLQRDDWHYECRFPGVISMMTMRVGATTTSFDTRIVKGFGESRVYVSAERERVLRACGWANIFGERADIDVVLERLCTIQCCRAAAIALFSLRLKKAIDILTKASESCDQQSSNLRLVAMSLAGFTARTEMWQDLCDKLLPTLTDPYLTAMFLFLSCRLKSDTAYESIINMDTLFLEDRIAFAAIHLADHPLNEYLQGCQRRAVITGILPGLIVSGLNAADACIGILQSYVDRTGDVQTAALALIHGGCCTTPTTTAPAPTTIVNNSIGVSQQLHSGSSSSRLQIDVVDSNSSPASAILSDGVEPGQNMIDAYLSLLNTWRMWQQRAIIDSLIRNITDMSSTTTSRRIQPQLYLSCTFCGRSLVPAVSSSSRNALRPGAGAVAQRPSAARSSACSQCIKPLPRCALCRRHMGTHLAPESGGPKADKLASWLAWCQTCRHGGHVVHLRQWFQNCSECPVSGCGCKCQLLDDPNDHSVG